MQANLEDLLSRLKSEDANVRFSAVSETALLGKNVGQQAVGPLRELLRDSDRDVKAAAAGALGLLETLAEEALPELISATKAPEEEVRVAAVGALRRVCPDGDRVLGALGTALRDSSALVRQSAAQGLGWLGPRAVLAVPALIKRADEPDPAVRRSVIWALGKVGPLGFEAAPALIKALADSQKDVRLLAAAGLGRIGPDARAAQPELVKMLSDPDGDVSKAAVWALGRTGPPEPGVVASLAALLDETDGAMATLVAGTLALFGSDAKEALTALLHRSRDPDDTVVRAIALAVEAIEPGAAVRHALPLPSADAPAHDPRLRTGIPDGHRQKTVLLADDSVFVRRVLREILEGDGYTVVGEAEDGQQAVALFAQTRPDLVMMDIQMPALSGVEATRQILAGDPGAVVVVCSVIANSQLIRNALEAGVSFFIAKPFEKSTVLSTVAQALKRV